jgi:fatty acid-binding protein DegV
MSIKMMDIYFLYFLQDNTNFPRIINMVVTLKEFLSSNFSTPQMMRDITSAPERVHIIDSLGASFGYGLLALLAQQILTSAVLGMKPRPKYLQFARTCDMFLD